MKGGEKAPRRKERPKGFGKLGGIESFRII